MKNRYENTESLLLVLNSSILQTILRIFDLYVDMRRFSGKEIATIRVLAIVLFIDLDGSESATAEGSYLFTERSFSLSTIHSY